MTREAPKAEFTDVDNSSDPQWYVNCLDEQHASGLLQRSKEHTLEALAVQEGQYILDAGCGTGIDALEMASLVGGGGCVIGIDHSAQMVRAARERGRKTNLPVSFFQSDIHHLAFADNTFNRCRSDKTFQHLSNPYQALLELIRVTKPGGKIVIADPDHETLVIDTPYREVNRRFAQFRSDAFEGGGIAHQLYRFFIECGLENVVVEPLTSVYTDYEERKITSPYLKEIWIAQEHGVVSHSEAEKWSSYLEEAIETGRFFCMQTYVITSGFKPSGS